METDVKNIIPVACDPGNASIKVIVNGKVYYIDTIIQKPYEARLVFGSGDKGSPLEFLDVDVEIGDIKGNFYVGSLAKGSSMESLGGFKSSNQMLLVTMMTSIAYALVTEFPSGVHFKINLGTGLPVHEFFHKNAEGKYTFEKVKLFQKKLAGIHKIKFNSNLFDKKEVTIEIQENHTIVMPEGYAALLSLLYDDKGRSRFAEYTKKNINIFGLDLGGGSSDVSAICNGSYIAKAMFGIDTGINKPQDKLCETIRSKANILNFSRYELNQYLFDPELAGKLETNKGTFDLNTEKVPFYKSAAENIAYEFRRRLHANGISIDMIHVLFLMGGASKELGDMVRDALKDDIPKIEKAADHGVDPRELNARAYYNAVRQMTENKAS